MLPVYLLIGLALVGSLYWALTQITLRQRRLTAELTRLERLTAEVAMSAEAVLEQVDERTERLAGLLTLFEARVEGALPGGAPAAPAPAGAAAAHAPAPAAPKKRGRPKKAAQPAAEAVSAQEPPAQAAAPAPATAPGAPDQAPAPATAPGAADQAPAPASIQRYQELRSAVWSLADQGREPGEIAQALGVPRGEVQLLINLRSKKVTA